MAMLRTVLGVNVCALFVCEQEVEICIGSLNKRSDEPAGPSSDVIVESGQSFASTSVTTVLNVANAIPPACTPTSCAPARANRCPYFVVNLLHSVVSLFLGTFTVNSSKTSMH